jgi:hypothetical protein
MIRRHGRYSSGGRIVTRRERNIRLSRSRGDGLEEMAFEAVVLRHTEVFSAAAVDASRKRLEQLKKP